MENLYDDNGITVCGYGESVYALIDTRRKPLVGQFLYCQNFKEYCAMIVEARLRDWLDVDKSKLILDERVPGWEKELAKRGFSQKEILPHKFEEDSKVIAALKTSLLDDVEKIERACSSGRGLLVDFIGGIAKLEEQYSFEIRNVEYDAGWREHYTHNFYMPGELLNGESSFFTYKDLVKEYGKIFRSCGVETGQTVAGKINEKSREIFSKKGKPLRNTTEIMQGKIYGFTGAGGFYAGEAESISGIKLDETTTFVIIRIKNKTADSKVSWDGIRFKQACIYDMCNTFYTIEIDSKGNLKESEAFRAIYNMPDVSEQQSTLSELRTEYDRRKSQLKNVEDKYDPWSRIETSQKHLKKFI